MIRQSLVILLLGLTLFLLSSPDAWAKIKPQSLFSDNAVLQKGSRIPVWGTTDRSEKVVVRIGGAEASAMPSGGKWRVHLAIEPGGPFPLSISQGDEKLEVKNVLIGEVWLCGGQSNMQWPVSLSTGAKEIIAQAGNPKLRLFTVERPKDGKGTDRPQTEVQGRWELCSPKSVAPFSAVAYAFGSEIQKKRAVPVGLISSNVGGTTAERWMSADALAADPQLARMPKPQGSSDLYNLMIAPLVPYSIRGAIWYQGESNVDNAYAYRELMPALIQNWRGLWQREDFPFLIVQLAPHTKPSAELKDNVWAELREAQLLTSQKMPNVHLAVITDLGDADIHPPKKAEVGQRLARIALATTYGEKTEFSGPIYEKMNIRGPEIVLYFQHVGSGLEARGGSLRGFAIAGADRKFHHAQAKIEGDTVVVSSSEVPQPVAVRYGWDTYPDVNLWNKDGLPASPFRTDAFRMKTQDPPPPKKKQQRTAT